MTITKIKQVKEKVQLNLENVIVGTSIKDLHGEDIKIDEDLISQMKAFERESKQHAIWKGKLTGSFLYFKWMKENPQEEKEKKKPGRKSKKVEEDVDIEELEEREIVNEEDMLLDCIADYKMEYGVKTVNTKSQKFKQFYYKWKQSD